MSLDWDTLERPVEAFEWLASSPMKDVAIFSQPK
jgi:hypothetical protein